jgi:ATPase subunit of ABC transporter with duplicated ATPase domains
MCQSRVYAASYSYLEQEPQLIDGATVGANLEAAVAETRHLLQAYTDATLEMSQEGADFDKIGEKVEKLQSEIEARDGNLSNSLSYSLFFKLALTLQLC